MTIEYVGDWNQTYSLYKASYKGSYAYGTTIDQAISNMLGVIQINKDNWNNYIYAKL